MTETAQTPEQPTGALDREPLVLLCEECGHVTTLDAAQQEKILAKLRFPAQVHIVECPSCHRQQFALGRRPRREANP